MTSWQSTTTLVPPAAITLFTEAQLSDETLARPTCFHSMSTALQLHHERIVKIYLTACKMCYYSGASSKKQNVMFSVFFFPTIFRVVSSSAFKENTFFELIRQTFMQRPCSAIMALHITSMLIGNWWFSLIIFWPVSHYRMRTYSETSRSYCSGNRSYENNLLFCQSISYQPRLLCTDLCAVARS